MTKLVKNEYCNATVTLKDNSTVDVAVSQLCEKDLNNFKGWYCAAGMDQIYINESLTVYSGQCYNDNMGNLMDENFKLFDNPTICKQESCGSCTSDLYTRKIRKD
jgi:hypothetical protein